MRARLHGLLWGLVTRGAWVFRRRGAFDPRGRWHNLYSPKERRCARWLTRRGILWQSGPTVVWLSHCCRGDLFLPDRGIVLEVLSSGEIEKHTLQRLLAFRKHGLRVEIVRDERDLAVLLGNPRGLT